MDSPVTLWVPMESPAATFQAPKFRALGDDVIRYVLSFLVDSLVAKTDDVDYVCKTFQLHLSNLRWTLYGHNKGSVNVVALSPKVRLLSPRLGRHLRELVVTLSPVSAEADAQTFQRHLLCGRDIQTLLPGLDRLHFRAGSMDSEGGEEAPIPSPPFLLNKLGACSATMTLVLEQCPVPEDLPAGLCALEMRQTGDPLSTFNFARLNSSNISSLRMAPIRIKESLWEDEFVVTTLSSGMTASCLAQLPPSLQCLELSSGFVIDDSTHWSSSLKELVLESPSLRGGDSLSLASGLTKLVLTIQESSGPFGFDLGILPPELEHLELHNLKGASLVGAFPSSLKTLVLDATAKTHTVHRPYNGGDISEEDAPGALASLLEGFSSVRSASEGASSSLQRDVALMLLGQGTYEEVVTPFSVDLDALPATLERLELKMSLRGGSFNKYIPQLPQFRGQLSAKLPALAAVYITATGSPKPLQDSHLRQIIARFQDCLGSRVQVMRG
jgi:hypothetical protein